ncbi:hypothetical protein [Streptomyces acidiscabies]|uniref:hypothetical protein n=1 Tax=Streptomyces acidiscabies TaxID=42234 RepID=UPI00096A41D4|nr:hypothetical protein [Streptomyces acidiscabies]
MTGVGRTDAVVGPWLIDDLTANGNQSWGFTTFALARRTGHGAVPATAHGPASAGATTPEV